MGGISFGLRLYQQVLMELKQDQLLTLKQTLLCPQCGFDIGRIMSSPVMCPCCDYHFKLMMDEYGEDDDEGIYIYTYENKSFEIEHIRRMKKIRKKRFKNLTLNQALIFLQYLSRKEWERKENDALDNQLLAF